MSTRSGKRIHSYLLGNIDLAKPEVVADNERKTRSKRLKENDDQLEVTLPKAKKKKNYVSYPNEEGDAATEDIAEKPRRRRNTLKEQNIISDVEILDSNANRTRVTRHTKKNADNQETEGKESKIPVPKKAASKKSKKKKSRSSDVNNDSQNGDKVAKKSKRKKKGKRSNAEEEATRMNVMNTSHVSSDSFHSAAGSPLNMVGDQEVPKKGKKVVENLPDSTVDENEDETVNNNANQRNKRHKRRASMKNASIDKDMAIADTIVEEKVLLNGTLEKNTRKRKSSLKNNTFDKDVMETDDKNTGNMPLNSTFDKIVSTRQSSIKNATFDKDIKESPVKMLDEDSLNKIFDKNSNGRRKSSIKNATFDKDIPESLVKIVDEDSLNMTFDKNSNGRRKSSIKNATFDKDTSESPVIMIDEDSMNKTFERNDNGPRKSSIKNATFDKIPETSDCKMDVDLNNSFDKIDKKRKSSIHNKTFEKEVPENASAKNITNDKMEDNTEKPNIIFEKPTKTRQSLQKTSSLDNTYIRPDRNEMLISPDISLEKSDTKLNTTFDRHDSKTRSDKSSLISSDGSLNVTDDQDPKTANKSSLISSDGTPNATYDKDMSRISLTSDDSKTENIMNTTPVLIESSMDESCTSKKSLGLDTSKDCSEAVKETLKPPVTPLKREGTFTKESPEVINISKEQSPPEDKSLPSPGCTPFHGTRSSKRSTLNVTRSLEKPTRRSSLAELLPRQTRVMFCSPVNNPAAVLQQKKKVIKSSLKGSNKSFVFDESASSVALAGARKRSYTASEAEAPPPGRAKRSRLAADLQTSVNRLSRPRTNSATAKLDSTTPKKPVTPLKPRPEVKRTRLPNFAALHQKQFDKMESLSECQQRRARRARLLLTPTGAVTVLERTSPKDPDAAADKKTATPTKEPATVKKTDTPTKEHSTAKKTDTATKEPTTAKNTDTPTKAKLPTLETLRPGFTRFGFKMHTDFNPFSIPSKTDNKNIEKPEKPNGVTSKTLPPKTPVQPTSEPPLQRQPTLPSLNGATTRKEAAKQTVMREKSFTSLSSRRDEKRKEIRTIIKGVRTNRRFDLQMKMRNVN